ncbi:MAG: hypothetical protein M1305_00590 [Candidatus Marsarchaeota archaeon]|nr:hypothetical protein [Candidatus Marsarchaeota archaeon]
MRKILEDVGVNTLAQVLFLVVVAIGEFLLRVWDRRDPRDRQPWFYVVGIVWLVANVAFVYWLSAMGGSPWSTVAFLVSAVVMAWIVRREVNRYWQVGLMGADSQTSRGIDYGRSLALVQNELDFLGIGASKLTREREFERAVERCRPDRAIRFLLYDPGSEDLQKAAVRAAKADPNEYRQNVTDSLRMLARLRQRFSNLEVRFYRTAGIPLRLMFIDQSICLVSYNVFGAGDGSALPQLHVVRQQGTREVTSFYYPFRKYFDQLWDVADPWDHTRYLNGL